MTTERPLPEHQMTRTNIRGLGDRWLAGESVPGIAFAQGEAVAILAGPHAEQRGTVVVLLGIEPEPAYLVQLGSGRGDVRVRQSALRPAGG
jgi:hypothetical protein